DLYRTLGQGEVARDYILKDLAIAERLAAAEPDRADYQRDLRVSYEHMGDLYEALGDGDKSREYRDKDLAIAERLAAAEPDRADYQVDLVISLVNVGTNEKPTDNERLQRALSIILALKREGRLAPADEPKIAAVQAVLSGNAPPGPLIGR